MAADRLDALVVFDGVCNLCSASVRFILAIDCDAVTRFCTVQSPAGAAVCRRNGIDPGDPSTFLFVDRGRVLQQSDAVAALLARMPWPYRGLAALAIVPRPLRDAAYRLVASNRYRLFGRREACLVPTPELRARFLDTLPEA